MHTFGMIVAGLGVLLLIGNITGRFKTFPFAGAIVFLIGTVLMHWAG